MSSAGCTLIKAHWVLRVLEHNLRTENGPQSLKEMREGGLDSYIVTWDWYQQWYPEIRAHDLEKQVS